VARQPLVSVVIATYNYASFIGETLDSVLAQTLTDHEIVVVDDGSTDDTEEAIRLYRDRIRYFSQQNMGVSAAWNRGIRESRGKLVAFLAADDCWEPEALQRIVAAHDAHPDVGLVSVMAREMTRDGVLTDRIRGKRSRGSYYTLPDLLRGGWCSWFAVERALVSGPDGFDERFRSAEECELCLRLFRRTRMYAIQEPLLRRRMHGDNLTRNRRLNASAWLLILDRLARDQPDLVRSNRRAYRRAVGKENLRLGRALMLGAGGDSSRLAQSRRHLRNSIVQYPFFGRAYLYLLSNLLFPRALGSWWRQESRRRG